ncbi:molecular chaperone DnaJ [bacterium]|nr:molecular chaperone DnaJ [bacterium]
MEDYYKILGVDKNASSQEIKEAFRKLAQKYHPDKPGGDAEKFKKINEAYQVLSDPEKRKMYDQYGASFEQARQRGGFSGFEGFRDWAAYMDAMKQQGEHWNFEDLGFGDLGDLFSDFFSFGDFEKRKGRYHKTKGEDIEIDLTISFREAVFGCKKEIKIERYVKCERCNGTGLEPGSRYITCPHCHGTGRIQNVRSTIFGTFSTVTTCPFCQGEGKIPEKKCSLCHGEGRIKKRTSLKIKIPAGIDNGQIIRFREQGNIGRRRGKSGDLYVRIRVKKDAVFSRRGFDILSKEKMTISQAVLGGKVKVRTLEGDVYLKIPPRTPSGQVFRLRNKGIVYPSGRQRGDQLVTVEIEIPKHLTKKQKELLEKLKQEGL